MSRTCFMIQPFDGGRFDKRYEDIFSPAVIGAGLEPYRVDQDPGVSIPIREIETGIEQATVCFADITENNPNVWFELGYALALKKDICIVCSSERTSSFPFDVQHRNITKYSVDSLQDFDELKKRITSRLKAILDKQNTRETLPSVSTRKDNLKYPDHIVACIASLAMQIEGLEGFVSHYNLKNEMEKFGYNNLATHVALRTLANDNHITIGKERDDFGSSYEVYFMNDSGWEWIANNLSSLKLHALTPGGNFDKEIDDEIPF